MDIFYFHGSDRQTPLEEQRKAANELYQEGKFERFGVSNLLVDEVQTIHDICKKEGYVLPTVYQGGYNPLMRSADELLFRHCESLASALTPSVRWEVDTSHRQSSNCKTQHRTLARLRSLCSRRSTLVRRA
jgi:aryl-alcohol dehydrogenase-like predicted oxidoreductase